MSYRNGRTSTWRELTISSVGSRLEGAELASRFAAAPTAVTLAPWVSQSLVLVPITPASHYRIRLWSA
jgi:hypothetical protein